MRRNEEMSFDEIDEKIIHILQNDARRSFVVIANEIGLSESAVRRRIKHLTDSGIIKKFTIELDETLKTSAITLISIDSTANTSTIIQQLLKLKDIKTIYEITGQYDIATIISAPTIVDINNCIDEVRKIDGIADTNTVIILRTAS